MNPRFSHQTVIGLQPGREPASPAIFFPLKIGRTTGVRLMSVLLMMSDA
jgi:hypothetical protein